MIQRIQTLYLLLAAGCAVLMFFLPVYGGTFQDGTSRAFMVGDNYILFLVMILLAVVPFVTIFLFKNRNLQKKLVWLGILLSILAIVLVYLKSGDFGADKVASFKAASFKISAALPVVALVLLFMAFSAIRKDEKLIRSVDRLR